MKKFLLVLLLAIVPAFSALTVPILKSPVNGAIVSPTPTLAWGSVVGIRVKYFVEIDSSNATKVMYSDSTLSTTLRVKKNLPHKVAVPVYTWKVRAKTTTDSSAWSSTSPSYPYFIVDSITPSDSSMGVACDINYNVLLSWDTISNGAGWPGLKKFHYEISTDSNFKTVVRGMPYSTTYDTDSALTRSAHCPYDTTYYWRIALMNGGDTSVVWRFSLKPTFISTHPATSSHRATPMPKSAYNVLGQPLEGNAVPGVFVTKAGIQLNLRGRRYGCPVR